MKRVLPASPGLMSGSASTEFLTVATGVIFGNERLMRWMLTVIRSDCPTRGFPIFASHCTPGFISGMAPSAETQPRIASWLILPHSALDYIYL